MSHLEYYGLKKEPFSIMPLTDFYYNNEQHDRAYLHLHRAIQAMKGLALLTGPVGTGKSLLARRLFESLPEEEYEVSLLVVLHSDVDSNWLVRRIAAQFGIEVKEDEKKVDIMTRLYRRLEEIAETGKRAAVLIDEAHMLRTQDLLEEIRGLLNLELPEQKLISFVFFGIPELDQVIALEPALAQRTAVRCELKPFPQNVIVDYIRFRLQHAGASREIFSGAALDAIFSFSKGIPRLVNVICDNSLFEGYIRKASFPLTPDIIMSVAEDLRLVAANN